MKHGQSPQFVHFPPCNINKGANTVWFSYKMLKEPIWVKFALSGKTRSQWSQEEFYLWLQHVICDLLGHFPFSLPQFRRMK